MTDTTTPDAPTADDWLARAEAERDQREHELLTSRLTTARALAEAINDALAVMGIEPMTPAAAMDDTGELVPALLVFADPVRKLYEVHATWEEDEERVLLLLAHWNRTEGYSGLRTGRLLRTLTDVVYARREGPLPAAQPVVTNDMRTVAARGIRRSKPLTDTDRITHAIGCLTAAVLHLIDTRP